MIKEELILNWQLKHNIAIILRRNLPPETFLIDELINDKIVYHGSYNTFFRMYKIQNFNPLVVDDKIYPNYNIILYTPNVIVLKVKIPHNLRISKFFKDSYLNLDLLIYK